MALLTPGIRRRLGAVCALALLLGKSLPANAAVSEMSREYQIKAVLLFNLTRFVDWPADAFAAPFSPIVIGILGHDPFGEILDKVAEGETVNGRKVVVQRYDSLPAVRPCHILFISASERARAKEIISTLKGRPILTVSDFEDFVRQFGGMVRFYKNEQSKIRLRINLDAARADRLNISARLLQVAEVEKTSSAFPPRRIKLHGYEPRFQFEQGPGGSSMVCEPGSQVELALAED